MNYVMDFVRNEILMSAALSWGLAQVIKTIIHLIVTKKFVAERLIGSGGMPSCHSATVCALTTSIIINEGIHSPFFAMSAILAIIVMYDARGVRRETGIQATVLNEMIEIVEKLGADVSYDEKLKEFIGHTPLQVLVGAIFGIFVALVYCLLIIR
ncbi:MAG: divergent PAP2 family protein [Lachnospiraceae bacterium]|nr:divergent PAP2 family protein [Lachnospiraceae bacterium]